MNVMDEHQEYMIELKTRIGKLKIAFSADMDSKNSFKGEASVIGVDIPVSGSVSESGHYSFPVTANLPIGRFEVMIEADVTDNGMLDGSALISGKKPMSIKGIRTV